MTLHSACLPARWPADRPPTLTVAVDTESEFDWARGYERTSRSIGHLRRLGTLQAVFDRHGIRPVYLVDYAVADQEAGVRPVREIVEDGRALLGAHLHPWVTPPFHEALGPRSSYPGNLPARLEREKLISLTRRIEQRFGERPRVYKAGRYGLGPNSLALLDALGYTVDLSPGPPMDFSADGGPDYSGWSCAPFWHGGVGRLLSIPASGAYCGRLQRHGRALYHGRRFTRARACRALGVLSRLGLIDRIWLSPEGYSFRQLRRLTTTLLGRGLRTFSLSLHSPSIEPGHTPYVRSTGDRDRLFATLDRYFSFFSGTLGGRFATPVEIRDVLRADPAPASPSAPISRRPGRQPLEEAEQPVELDVAG